jgi:hypothetical protein
LGLWCDDLCDYLGNVFGCGKHNPIRLPYDKSNPIVYDNDEAIDVYVDEYLFNPRDGTATNFANYSTSGPRHFIPPDSSDWVLILDDASQKFPIPGASPAKRLSADQQ